MQKSLIFLLLFIKSLASFSQPEQVIPKVFKTFEVNSIIDINKCIKWHVDFTELKSTVLYKKHFISMGKYGGMVAYDTNLTAIDQKFTNELNSDLYTNIAVKQDTLFAEKFEEIYFYKEEKQEWIKYKLNEPILLFDILYEDEKYVFFPFNGGEWGSKIFIYNKTNNKIAYIQLSVEVISVYKTNNEYYVNACNTFDGSNTYFKIFDIDNLQFQNIKNIEEEANFLKLASLDKINQKNKIILFNRINNLISNSSFIYKNNYFHFSQISIGNSIHNEKTYLSYFKDDKYIVFDTIDNFVVSKAKNIGKTTILEGSGLIISHKDTLFKISFKEYGKGFTVNDISTYENKKITNFLIFKNSDTTLKYCLTKYFDSSPEFYNSIEKFKYKIKCNLSILSCKIPNKLKLDNYELYMVYFFRKYKLHIVNPSNFLYFCFYYGKNIFLYFNSYKNIGLIEIYNLEKFIEEYKAK